MGTEKKHKDNGTGKYLAPLRQIIADIFVEVGQVSMRLGMSGFIEP